jgi:plasmid maintenance system killer protein
MQDRALRKLRQLDTALTLDDLRNPPGNHLESLNRLLKKPSSSPRWHQTTCKVV